MDQSIFFLGVCNELERKNVRFLNSKLNFFSLCFRYQNGHFHMTLAFPIYILRKCVNKDYFFRDFILEIIYWKINHFHGFLSHQYHSSSNINLIMFISPFCMNVIIAKTDSKPYKKWRLNIRFDPSFNKIRLDGIFCSYKREGD